MDIQLIKKDIEQKLFYKALTFCNYSILHILSSKRKSAFVGKKQLTFQTVLAFVIIFAIS